MARETEAGTSAAAHGVGTTEEAWRAEDGGPRLHPQARAALEEAAGSSGALIPGRPGFDVARARTEARSRAELRTRAGDRPPRGSRRPAIEVRDVAVGGVGCRLFRPDRGRPVVVYLHGGGWALGSIAECHDLCGALAERSGRAVLAVDYRLAPEHPYPAAIADVEAVLAGLPLQERTLEVQTGRMALAGDSAGANLAASLALRARDRSERAVPWLAQVLVYPVLDLVGDHPSQRQFAAGYGLDRGVIDWCTRAYAPDESVRSRADVSPLLAATLAGLPPTLIVTAGTTRCATRARPTRLGWQGRAPPRSAPGTRT